VTILDRLVKARNTVTIEQFSNVNMPSMGRQRSGANVTKDSALRQAAVWACIRLRAETIGMLPVQVVEYRGAERVPLDLPVWLQRPNPEMTSFDLFERTSASLDVDGNSFWWVERDKLGRVVEVWPLPPANVNVSRNRDEVKRFKIGNEQTDYGPERIFHISGFTLPGRLRGLSPIEQHANAIGLAVAAEEYGENFFANGAVMSGIIESPQDPGEVAAKRMQSSFERDHRGLRNAHRPGFLFGGAKWTQLTIPNDAAQFLESRKFQISEIARIFRVPPHKIGDLERATFSNIEHQAIEWVTDGVMPYTARIERAVLAAGLLDRESRLKFNLAGLLRGDTASRFAAYAIGRQWGWLNADDIRAFEDLNPLPDGQGQAYLEPLNMVSAGSERADALAVAPKGSKVGARNSADDMRQIQSAHDALTSLGAKCEQLALDMGAEDTLNPVEVKALEPPVTNVTINNYQPEQKAGDVHVTTPEVVVNNVPTEVVINNLPAPPAPVVKVGAKRIEHDESGRIVRVVEEEV